MKAFVYCWTNIINSKKYVGKALNPQKRWKGHLGQARQGHQSHFHRAIRKWGPDVFVLDILEECASEAAAFVAETRWIALLKTNQSETGYNMNEGGLGGGLPTPEVLVKLRRPRSEATKLRMRKPKTAEHRQRIRETKLGEQNPQYGRALSEGHRAKLSQALSGERNGFFGKTHTNEVRERMRLAQGSIETKQKVSRGVKAAWARRRKASQAQNEQAVRGPRVQPPLRVRRSRAQFTPEERAERRAKANRARGLPEDTQKEVLRLYNNEHLTAQEVALRLHISKGSVRATVNRWYTSLNHEERARMKHAHGSAVRSGARNPNANGGP